MPKTKLQDKVKRLYDRIGSEFYLCRDDFVISENSKLQLEIWKRKINNFLVKELKINLHINKSKIISLHHGVSILGFRVFYYYRLLNKKNIKQIKRKIIELRDLYEKGKMSFIKMEEKLSGWIVHASYGDTYNLRRISLDFLFNTN